MTTVMWMTKTVTMIMLIHMTCIQFHDSSLHLT